LPTWIIASFKRPHTCHARYQYQCRRVLSPTPSESGVPGSSAIVASLLAGGAWFSPFVSRPTGTHRTYWLRRVRTRRMSRSMAGRGSAVGQCNVLWNNSFS
jgi:hypothetical protein